jgi:hypothetical protein
MAATKTLSPPPTTKARARVLASTQLRRLTSGKLRSYFLQDPEAREITKQLRGELRLVDAIAAQAAANRGGAFEWDLHGTPVRIVVQPAARVGLDGAESVASLEQRLLQQGERGMQSVLKSKDMLNLVDAAAVAGVAARTLSNWRNEGKVLALVAPGAEKGFRFPRWQFEPTVKAAIPEIIDAFGIDRQWQAHDFLTHPEPLLGGLRPLKELQSGRREAIGRVIEAAAKLGQGGH